MQEKLSHLYMCVQTFVRLCEIYRKVYNRVTQNIPENSFHMMSMPISNQSKKKGRLSFGLMQVVKSRRQNSIFLWLISIDPKIGSMLLERYIGVAWRVKHSGSVREGER